MKNDFLQRAITGILFAAIIMGCILYGPLAFGTLFVIVGALTIREFSRLVSQLGEVAINRTIAVLGGAYLFLALMGLCIDAADSKIFIPYLVLLIYLMVSKLYLRKGSPVLNQAYSMLSQMYVTLPLALLSVLVFQNDPETTNISYNPILPLSILVPLRPNDMDTYCFDSLLGKHRLFERAFPKKSWEGSIGGGIAAIAASFAFAYFFPIMTQAEWAGLALVVAIFGTWGDLTGSPLRHQLQVKDSGGTLPGHDGMFDCFDNLFMAIPAEVVYSYVPILF